MAEKDTSLASIFDGVVEPEESTEEKDSSSDNEPKKEEAKKEPNDKPEIDDDSSPSDEKKEEEKSKEPDKQKVPPSDEKKPEEKKEDKKPSDESFEKRWKDTHTAWNREHQENIQLRNTLQQQARDVEILKKKAAGTWTEADEQANSVTPESIATASLNVGKALASRNAAYRMHGQEKVDSELIEFHTLFEGNPIVQATVVGDESPVLRALDIMERYRFETKYGADPKSMYENIEKEVKGKLEKELRKQITEELLEGKRKKDSAPGGLSSSRGSSGLEGKSKEDFSKGPPPLESIFGK